jgi:hypothetical protein
VEIKPKFRAVNSKEFLGLLELAQYFGHIKGIVALYKAAIGVFFHCKHYLVTIGLLAVGLRQFALARPNSP